MFLAPIIFPFAVLFPSSKICFVFADFSSPFTIFPISLCILFFRMFFLWDSTFWSNMYLHQYTLFLSFCLFFSEINSYVSCAGEKMQAEAQVEGVYVLWDEAASEEKDVCRNHFIKQEGYRALYIGLLIINFMKTNFKLKSSQSFRAINQAHTNRSKTKATYSFSKSPRFSLDKTQCPTGTYAGEHILRKNSGAAIGYGKKSDFTKDLTVSPASSRYNLRTTFQENQHKKRGYSLRKGREEVVYDSYISKQQCRTPSANKYRNEVSLKHRAPIFSMRKKTKILDKTATIDAQNINPGPGSYENPQIQYGSTASKFTKISYSSGKSHRFMNSDNKVPGPASYHELSNLSNVGKYIVSAHKGGTRAKFDSQRRVTKFDEASRFSSLVPGPGNYKSPSEFGQYDGDIYQTLNTINVPLKKRRR